MTDKNLRAAKSRARAEHSTLSWVALVIVGSAALLLTPLALVTGGVL